MADQIVVLHEGNIEQVNNPLDFYNHPVNKFVACFIGAPRMNFIVSTYHRHTLGLNGVTQPTNDLHIFGGKDEQSLPMDV